MSPSTYKCAIIAARHIQHHVWREDSIVICTPTPEKNSAAALHALRRRGMDLLLLRGT